MPHMAGSPVRTISVLVVHLLLVSSCRGQSQLIGPSQPVVATVGDDVVLPCHLNPAVDVAAKTLEWTKLSLKPIFVFVWRAGQDLVNLKDPSYEGRTSVFINELKNGNISVRLSRVKPSDEGRYRCSIVYMGTNAVVDLVVDAVATPVITLSGLDKSTSGVVLDCESKDWYPEPEVSWLDSEGHVLSAGPPETVRGPDGLYTVSSRVTVEKRHGNSFTCRVHQKTTNQTRETQIHVPDDFFEVQSRSFSVAVGLSVGLAVSIVIILILVYFEFKRKKEQIRQFIHHLIYEKWNKKFVPPMTDETRQLQSSTRGLLIEIDQTNKLIRLRNSLDEEQNLGGWRFYAEINNKIFSHTFEESLRLSPGDTLTMSGPSKHRHSSPGFLVWTGLKSWECGDKLHVFLLNNDRQTVQDVVVVDRTE